MRIESGIVIEESQNMVLVEFLGDRGCSSCASAKSCPFCAGGGQSFIWIDNTIGAVKGDAINFIIEEKNVIMASAFIYLLPTILLVCGSVLGHIAAAAWGLDGDLFTGIGGIAGLLLFVVILKTASELFNKRRIFQPVLVNGDDSQKLSQQ